MSPIFLETTIQIQRLMYAPKIRHTINAVVQEHEVYTSTYVWMELQRTVGQDYQYLIDLLNEQLPDTLSDFFYLVGEYQNVFSARRPGRIINVLGQLVSEFPGPEIDPLEIAEYLDSRRRWIVHNQFFHGIDHVVDTTLCDLIKPDYTIPQGGRMSCRRETAQCALPNLLSQHSHQLHQLQNNEVSLSSLDTTTRQSVLRVTEDVEMAKGERTCWPLGDLIIVLECPQDALLWTTNLRHFEPLCQIFGRQLYR